MSDQRVKVHPQLGILVSTEGYVIQPGDKWHKSRKTYGSKHNNEYMSVCVNYKEYSVHRLVLETFVGPCLEGYEADHRNRNRSDNRLSNLHYVTRAENQRNTCKNDSCDKRLGIHSYEDYKEYNKRNCHDWYMRNRDTINEKRRAADKTEINNKRRERYASNPELYRAKQREYRLRKKEK